MLRDRVSFDRVSFDRFGTTVGTPKALGLQAERDSSNGSSLLALPAHLQQLERVDPGNSLDGVVPRPFGDLRQDSLG